MERAKRTTTPVSYREMNDTEMNADLVVPPPSRARERPERRTGKESPLDSLAGKDLDVPGAPGLCFSLGGEGTGGQEAERILREVEIDDDAIQLHGQFANCRRVLLAQGSRGLAAAVVELKAHEKVFEIPILASARNQRQQGHGSVLVALLFEIAASLGATMVVVSATMESRRFWMTQGFHTLSHAEPSVGAAMRALNQKGVRYGYFQTTPMARLLPEAAASGALVAAALVRAQGEG